MAGDPREEQGRATAIGAFRAAIRSALAQVPGWLPAKVTAWNAPRVVDGFEMPACVDLEILLQAVVPVAHEDDAPSGWTVRSTPTGLEARGPYRPPKNVPVCYPGPRALRLRGPLAVGEQGILLLSTRAIETWAAGYAEAEGGPTDPILGIGFRPAAGVFLPGLEVGATEGAGFPASEPALGDPLAVGSLAYDGAGAWDLSGLDVEVNAPAIRLGGPGATAVAKNAQVVAALNAFNAALQGGVAFTAPQKAEIAAAIGAATVLLLGSTTTTVL